MSETPQTILERWLAEQHGIMTHGVRLRHHAFPKLTNADFDLLLSWLESAIEYGMTRRAPDPRVSVLIKAGKQADEEITAIYDAFGAPGDYGYGTREGKALYALYKFQPVLRAALKAMEE